MKTLLTFFALIAPALTKQFNRRDTNKDAKLTLEELKKTK